ncbi:luciferase family oxidoreductase group 1 [Paenibacillus shirakamiensis]|uniref:Luciferase family oxidoreductase group 1 n=1 Tax=Paenibacillus shirakamiensis TaxID=1265935 RepID=A0ABS4JCK5_9BACL|nr:LLM class flavin-dependent oxidoreductase [Paenibacillus shirakamiensis]MBP1999461.1 luciferase family oxidoreductase group 1 [Paenibacillus shirakamiensis]
MEKIQLSILDQSPVYAGETPEEALIHTIQLARQAEQWGYKRFWVSEHHNTKQLAGSSPEVLISFLLAQTSKIRIGSGGIMLQHYSPYKVAENFNLLSSLAPGRVDLGIGRAPGGFPKSTQALQKGVAKQVPLEEKLTELQKYVQSPLQGAEELHATPVPAVSAELYLLGTSSGSAELAAEQGLPYVFAHFINSDPLIAAQAIERYREQFNRTKGQEPRVILALSLVAAETDDEAEHLVEKFLNVKVFLGDGKSVNLTTIESAEEFGQQSGQSYTIEAKEALFIRGSKETIRKQLLSLQQQYNVDEFIITAPVRSFSAKWRSYELIQEAFAEQPV